MRRIATCAFAATLAMAAALPALAQGGGRDKRPQDKAPALGAAAPDFDLEVLGRKERVRLSDACKDKPVVLIFGSYT